MTTLGDWKTVEPYGYYKNFIDKNSRPDGREWMESRPLLIKTGSIKTANGSATVRLGNTSVVCGIKAEIATPTLRQPDQGFVVPNVELYPCCSPNVKAGPPGEKAICASQFLQDVITDSAMLDLTQLCIISNKIVWCLYCDVICLDLDGNLHDAALIALVAALQNVKLPKVSWDEESEKITKVTKKKRIHLDIKSHPVSTTFGLYEHVFMLDPSSEDEEFCQGTLTIVFKGDQICTTLKPGGRWISQEHMDNLISVANKRVSLVNTAIKSALDAEPT